MHSNPAKPESTGNAGDKTSASSPGKESEAAAEKPPERTTADSKSAALQDFSLHVPAGQKAVIIGRTGRYVIMQKCLTDMMHTVLTLDSSLVAKARYSSPS